MSHVDMTTTRSTEEVFDWSTLLSPEVQERLAAYRAMSPDERRRIVQEWAMSSQEAEGQ